MAKNRGCSCWPFLRGNNQKQKKLQIRQSQETNEESNSARDYNQLREQNNFLRIQRGGEIVDYNVEQLEGNSTIHRARTQEINRLNLNQLQQEVVERNDTEEIRKRNKVRIKTKISKKIVKFVNEYPSDAENQKVFKYCCPICLRYFNHMLISSCCKNYICRLCIGEMARKAKNNRDFVIKCSHCFEDDFKLDDVKPGDTVKFYTDTPFKYQTKTSSGQKKEQSPVIEKPTAKVDDENIEDKDDEKSNKKLIPQDHTISQEPSPVLNRGMALLGSPLQKIHLNDLSQLDTQMINLQKCLAQGNLRHVLVGDMEHPEYESPFSAQKKAQQDNKLSPILSRSHNSNHMMISSPDNYYIGEPRQHFLMSNDEEEKEGIIAGFEDSSLDDKMRLLQQVHSRKSLISNQPKSLKEQHKQHFPTNTMDSKFLLEHESNFKKLLDEIQRGNPNMISNRLIRSSQGRVSDSAMSHNLRISLSKNQNFEVVDPALILNRFSNVNQVRKASGFLMEVQPFKMRVQSISQQSHAKSPQRVFEQRNHHGYFKTTMRHHQNKENINLDSNSPFQKQPISSTFSPNIIGLKGKLIEAIKTASNQVKRLPLHDLMNQQQLGQVLPFNQVQIQQCLTDQRDEYQDQERQQKPQMQIIRQRGRRTSSSSRRSLALKHISQEIISPHNRPVIVNFEMRESQIKLRQGPSLQNQASQVNESQQFRLKSDQDNSRISRVSELLSERKIYSRKESRLKANEEAKAEKGV